MGESLGRDRDEMKSRADMSRSESFQKTKQLRVPSDCVFICLCFSSE